jgi:hypothetical protein
MTRTVSTKLGIALVAVALGSATVGAGPVLPARADLARTGLPGGFSSWGQLFDAQEILDNAAFRIQAASDATSGYAGVSVDVTSHSLTLYWKGELSPQVRGVVAAIRASGTGVGVVAARYSKAELDVRVDLITKDAFTTGGSRLLTVTSRPDGSGIDVGVESARRPSGRSATGPVVSGRDLTHLQQAMRDGGVDVTEQAPPVNYFREADIAPFYAGALLRANGGGCTSGFATHKPATGETFLMTAAHCGDWGTVYFTNAGLQVGRVTKVATERDVAFISTDSAGSVYDGPPIFQSGQFVKHVKGVSHSNRGDFVCLSGALTGAFCWTQVVNTDVVDCSKQAVGCVHTVGATSQFRPPQFIAGEGDSGGPVFALTDNDTADIARGLIHSSWGPVKRDCFDPLTNSNSRKCATSVLFVDVLNGMAPFAGMEILTR